MRLAKLTGILDYKMAKFSAVRVRLSTDYYPPTSSTWGVIPFNSVQFDFGGYFDADTYRWTPPRGFFIAYLICDWNELSSTHAQAAIVLDESMLVRSMNRDDSTHNQTKQCLLIGETDGSSYIECKANRWDSGRINASATNFYAISFPKNRGKI